jgi:dTDP-3-amino-3,4,6-trideoxy-alpha-D-glucose transaminase
VREEIDGALAKVLDSSRFILGAEVAAFEEEFAAYCGASYCVGVGTGLDALTLTLRALGAGPGDEILVPGQTFVATWLAVTATGATPIGVDIEPDTSSMDVNLAASLISPRTIAIMPVHLYGHPADVDGLRALANQHGIPMIEDAAQAHGATVGARRAGALGLAAGFSFYPSKNLGAIGDGGAVVTNDSEIARKVRLLRNYGSASKYQHDILGSNSRLDELQAAVLRIKLKHLDDWNSSREERAHQYLVGLDELGIQAMRPRPGSRSSWHLLVVRSSQRDKLAAHLQQAGIGTLVHYPVAPHRTPAYATPGEPAPLPESERSADEVLSLPLFPGMLGAEVDRVLETLANIPAPRA